MVFDKIKDIFSGDSDLGDMASQVGLGDYAQYLEGVTFPIGKDDLLVALRENGAQDALLAHVESLSQGRFENASEIFKNFLNK